MWQVPVQHGLDCVLPAPCRGSMQAPCRLMLSSLMLAGASAAVLLKMYLPARNAAAPCALSLQLPAVTLPLQQLAVRLFDGQLQNVGKPCVGAIQMARLPPACVQGSAAVCMQRLQVMWCWGPARHALSMPAVSQYIRRPPSCPNMPCHTVYRASTAQQGSPHRAADSEDASHVPLCPASVCLSHRDHCGRPSHRQPAAA
jgi:hypothetical protein